MALIYIIFNNFKKKTSCRAALPQFLLHTNLIYIDIYKIYYIINKFFKITSSSYPI